MGAGLEPKAAEWAAYSPEAQVQARDERATTYQDDAVHRWRAPLMVAVAAAVSFTLARLVPLPALTEGGIFTAVSLFTTRMTATMTGVVPFSVAELLLVAYATWVAVLCGRAVASVARRRRRVTNALAGAGRRVVLDAGVFVLLFYAMWGMNYARPTYATQAGWPEITDVDAAEMIALARASVEWVNSAYRELHGVDDAGRPTTVGNRRALEAALEQGWREAAAHLGLHTDAARPRGRMKYPLLSGGVARLGIAGQYVPFTAEAHTVRNLPASRMPMTMAHEKAHQRGFAREADANFLGFAAASLAPDPLARYSAAVFAHGQLLAALPRGGLSEYSRIAAERLPGVQRDLTDSRAFWNRRAGPIADFGSSLNDRFLSVQGISGGTADYRRSVWMIVAYSRMNEGKIGPGR